MTEFNRNTVNAIFEGAGVEKPPKDVLTELCNLHLQNTSEKDDRIKELKTSLAAAEQERDALKAEGGKEYRQKYEDTKKELDDLHKSIAEKEAKAARAKAARAYFEKKKITGDNLEIAMRAAAAEIDALELDGETIKDTTALDALTTGTLAGLASKTKTVGADIPHPPEKAAQNAFETMSLAEKMRYANENPNDASVKEWLKR